MTKQAIIVSMSHAMRQVTEAIYTNGVLKPLHPLELRESERVRLMVEKLDAPPIQDREALLAKLRQGIERMNFRSNGRYPSRDELHDRD
jgi:predicted DNA-binding antitoxin AbrB/MazE fold protein